MLKRLMKTDDDLSAFVLRLALGLVIFPHGAQKLLGWFGGPGFQGAMEFFTGNGIPAVLAFLLIMAESFGSLGLIVGFLSRIAAFGIGGLMLGAIFLVHAQNGFFMNWAGIQDGEGFEYHILALGLVIGILIRGSGKWSLDRLLTKKA